MLVTLIQKSLIFLEFKGKYIDPSMCIVPYIDDGTITGERLSRWTFSRKYLITISLTLKALFNMFCFLNLSCMALHAISVVNEV